MSVNDPSELVFVRITEQLGSYGRIKLHYAVDIIQIQYNGDFTRGKYTEKKEKNNNQGFFSFILLLMLLIYKAVY